MWENIMDKKDITAIDSILITPPVSSPLHPQLSLPLLKSYLTNNGFSVKLFDTNIMFFHYFLGASGTKLDMAACLKEPMKVLGYYNDLERQLWEKSKSFDGLHIGLRSLRMKYDRIYFDSVIASLEDKKANPFIHFYEQFINQHIKGTQVKIVGIAVIFQDQIIPAFTLASLLRKLHPEIMIAMGGQIITRCYDTMVKNKNLCKYLDYMALWDGEETLLDIHRKVVRHEKVKFFNVIDVKSNSHTINRTAAAPNTEQIPSPDFDDINFNDYYFPDMLVPFQTTRGCYAKCAFCAIPFGSNSYRVRSVDKILDDIVKIQELTLKKYGRKAVFYKFMEDTSSPELLKQLAIRIKNRGLDVKWETFARLEKAFADDGFMEQLYQGGCRKIHWGLESNDPDILSVMHKKTSLSYTDKILKLSARAGILNFCFILVGFPGETDQMREKMKNYIINNPYIHTLTLATFDLTRKSPMEQEFSPENQYELDIMPARDFQVRLPYTVNGENWKESIISKAHKMMVEIIKGRPDIGLMTLFPDQIRTIFCEKFGNEWGSLFVQKYGKENIKEMLLSAEKYIKNYNKRNFISPDKIPEPFQREHFRSKEDIEMIAVAVQLRKDYERRRFNQV